MLRNLTCPEYVGVYLGLNTYHVVGRTNTLSCLELPRMIESSTKNNYLTNSRSSFTYDKT